jgi:hypothetical protein
MSDPSLRSVPWRLRIPPEHGVSTVVNEYRLERLHLGLVVPDESTRQDIPDYTRGRSPLDPPVPFSEQPLHDPAQHATKNNYGNSIHAPRLHPPPGVPIPIFGPAFATLRPCAELLHSLLPSASSRRSSLSEAHLPTSGRRSIRSRPSWASPYCSSPRTPSFGLPNESPLMPTNSASIACCPRSHARRFEGLQARTSLCPGGNATSIPSHGSSMNLRDPRSTSIREALSGAANGCTRPGAASFTKRHMRASLTSR